MADIPNLHEVQHTLIHYLRGGDEQAAGKLVAKQPPLSVQARLSIYSNAYKIRLSDVLAVDHEILHSYLGDEHFAELTAGYIRQTPSSYTSLRDFGNQLPAFLATNEPYKALPALHQLAAFERLLLDAFDARDTERAKRDDLQVIAQENWPGMQLRFHPSVQIFTDNSGAVTIWKAMKNQQPPPDIKADMPTVQWLLWRGTDRLSQFRSLPAQEHLLLDSAMHGQDFAVLCESLLGQIPDNEISGLVLNHLLDWLDQGLIQHLNY